MDRVLAEFAPAKVNLTLRVMGRRPDGYHDLESLVVFADVGDRLTFGPGDSALAVRGPMAQGAGLGADNLVLKAVHALLARVPVRSGRFTLTKRLPVAAGVGGGSSDAAAALRLLARANGLPPDDARVFDAARATGADVPVCLDPRPRIMRGIGDLLSAPLDLPPMPAVLVNPGVRLATKDVFAALAAPPVSATVPARSWDGDDVGPGLGGGPRAIDKVIARLRNEPNDLEPTAISLAPVVADVLAVLLAQEGCRLARMSGAGASCFALFGSRVKARRAARSLMASHPDWWVRATVLNGRNVTAVRRI